MRHKLSLYISDFLLNISQQEIEGCKLERLS